MAGAPDVHRLSRLSRSARFASHRIKFFSDCLLDVSKLHQALPCLKSAFALQDAQDKLTVLVRPNGGYAAVKLSFFGGLGFGRLCSPEETMDGVLQVASLADLMATKLKVLMRRSQAKDYLDLAAMIEASVSLPQGLAAAREMFGPAFQPSEALKAMTYFESSGLDSLPRHTVRTLVHHS